VTRAEAVALARAEKALSFAQRVDVAHALGVPVPRLSLEEIRKYSAELDRLLRGEP